VLNLVCGEGGDIGSQLVTDGRVKAISFTGSTEVGRRIHELAAAGLTPTQLEMGGKNAAVVLRDADLDLAVADCVTAGYACAGQWCTSTSRVLLESPIAAEFMERFVARVKALRVGPGVEEKTDMGPVASDSQLQRAVSYLQVGRDEGARVVTGGSRIVDGDYQHGYFFQPTVLDQIEPGMRVSQEEIFGPVVCCLEVADLEAALAVANGVEFGLSASVYTRDLGRAQRFIDGVEAGLVHVNLHTAYKEPQLPFGGRKASGAGPPEAGDTGIQFYTQHKAVYCQAEI
jgi:aldehyde dehydrogenase (NAD+)